MDARTKSPWSGLLWPTRTRKSRSDRHYPRRTWRRWLGVVSKATLGLLLVGCTTIPGLRRSEPIDPVATLKSGSEGNKRIEAYRMLSKVDELPIEQQSAARKLLMEGAANEYNILARTAAIAGLRSIPDAEATRILLAATSDKSPVIRIEAIHSLRDRKDAGIVEALRDRLTTDSDPDVRIAAVEELVARKEPSLVPVLIESLRDGELSVAHRAAEGLREITQAPVQGDKYQDWKAWADGTPRPPQEVEQTASKSRFSGLFDVFRR
ncbi:HEAT repeat domain-containing protein [bacterium]|nr:HEAT repeat domain-containing protein [bacterium]